MDDDITLTEKLLFMLVYIIFGMAIVYLQFSTERYLGIGLNVLIIKILLGGL